MPLVTQYIAPVTAPTWENAVTNAPYGTGEGFTFGLAAAGDDPYCKNYVIKVNGVYKSAWSKWVKLNQDGVEWSWPATYDRSVASSRRYLYPVTAESLADGAIVFHPGENRVELMAWKITEALVANNHLDDQGSGADYVQCVHTDWVYTVTFDANGGAGKMNPFAFTNSAALPVSAFTMEGCDFVCWSNAVGTATYEDGATVSCDLDLVAVFTDPPPTVDFGIALDANGGAFETGLETQCVRRCAGDIYGDMPTPTNGANRAFAGWWTSTNPVDRVQVFETNVVDSATTNLYARWKSVAEAELCTLTFKLPDGGTCLATNALEGTEYGDYFPDPAPTDGDYTLFGWYAGNVRVRATDVVQGSATLTAKWTLGAFNDAWNCYDIVFDAMTGDNYFGPWTMDETGVARSAYRDPAGKGELSTLKMTPESPGKLALELKASCPPQPDEEVMACLDLYKNTLDCRVARIAGPQDFKMSEEVHVDSSDTLFLEYYCYSELDVSGYEDCGWARNLVWTPDYVPTSIDGWTSYSSVRRGTWTTGGAAPWTTVETNADLAASGAIADGRSSWIKLAVPARAGVLSFKWRTSCEAGYVDTNGVYRACDRLEFSDERGEGLRIEGVSGDLAEVVWTNDVEASHVFTWRYVKDGDVAEGEDGAWLKDVVWTPFPRQPSPMRIFIW